MILMIHTSFLLQTWYWCLPNNPPNIFTQLSSVPLIHIFFCVAKFDNLQKTDFRNVDCFVIIEKKRNQTISHIHYIHTMEGTHTILLMSKQEKKNNKNNNNNWKIGENNKLRMMGDSQQTNNNKTLIFYDILSMWENMKMNKNYK